MILSSYQMSLVKDSEEHWKKLNQPISELVIALYLSLKTNAALSSLCVLNPYPGPQTQHLIYATQLCLT